MQGTSTEIIFAESVGSCADIVATVIKSLMQSYPDLEMDYEKYGKGKRKLALSPKESQSLD
ncbi:MAG TPA: hypothetical protein VK084_01555 [Chitinophagaceae bacterium]|nr:hypothetical protein [Chitinophagaceae bacterium]